MWQCSITLIYLSPWLFRECPSTSVAWGMKTSAWPSCSGLVISLWIMSVFKRLTWSLSPRVRLGFPLMVFLLWSPPVMFILVVLLFFATLFTPFATSRLTTGRLVLAEFQIRESLFRIACMLLIKNRKEINFVAMFPPPLIRLSPQCFVATSTL